MRRLTQWLRAAFRRGTLDREMRQEMREHLDLSTQRYLARGMSLAEARYAARREFGNIAVLEEQGRDARGAVWLESVRGDLRYAVRALRASPAFATVAILSLAIGIGANTAIFSLIDSVMLKSLPVVHPEQLVVVTVGDSASDSGLGAKGQTFGNSVFTNPMWEQIRDRGSSFGSYAVSGTTSFDLASGGEARPAAGEWVNGDFFRTLGVHPAVGRLFTAADDKRGCPATAVLGYRFWQSELGGREDVVGRAISLSTVPFTIIGVTPPSFFGVDVGSTIQVFTPLCTEPLIRGKNSALDHRSSWWLRVMARPTAGISPRRFSAQIRSISRAVFESSVPPSLVQNRAEFLSRRLGATEGGNGMSVLRTQYSRALMALMAMVGLILVISCANVANLLLARAAARSREIAIRIAVGGSRVRIVRQLLTESILLALVGAVIGSFLAAWGSRFLIGMMASGRSPVALDLSIDVRVLGFTAVVSIATVVLFGVVPAWRGTNVDPHMAMKTGGRGQAEGYSRFRIGKALVVAQSALALILVVGAGLLVSTFRSLNSADPGFRSDGVLLASDVQFRKSAIPPSAYGATRRRLLEQFRAIPGVQAAAVVQITPVSGSTWNDAVVTSEFSSTDDEQRLSWFNEVSDGYFKTMSTRFLAGRDFGSQDVVGSTSVAIVNRAMANRFFHNGSAVGKVYRIEDQGTQGPPVTIIGVVQNTRYRTMRDTAEPIIYLPASQDSAPSAMANYVLKISGSATAIISQVKSIVGATDPRISLSFAPLTEQIARSLQRERILATLSGAFGTLALVLAMIGLYGVMAYTVARRRVEIGIRIALGAARSRVVRMVLGDVGRMMIGGIVIGGIGAFAGTRFLASFLYGVKATDAATILSAALILVVAAALAGAIPARRAARLEPVEALRED
jgi:putative ABC transport system permease protein